MDRKFNGGVPNEVENAAVTRPCQRTRPVSDEAGVGLSGVAKGVVTVNDTGTSGSMGTRGKGNAPVWKYRVDRRCPSEGLDYQLTV